jgi:C-terminal processing protease CtpA/Prc
MKKATMIVTFLVLIVTLSACSNEPGAVDIGLISNVEDASLFLSPDAPVKGDEVTIEATEIEGHQFVQWIDSSSNEVISESLVFSMIVREDKDFKAIYDSLEFVTLTMESSHEAAELIASKNTGYVGDEVTIEASMVEGYSFLHWEIAGTVLTDSRTHILTLETSVLLKAVYEEKPKDAIGVDLSSTTPNASLSIKNRLPFYSGDQVSVEASDVEGYEFSYWSDAYRDNLRSQSQTYTFEARESTTLKAVYEQLPNEKRTVDFENLASEYDPVNTTVELHYYEDEIAYINIETFLDMMDCAIIKDSIEISKDYNSITMSFIVDDSEETDGAVVEDETEVSLRINTEDDTLKASHFYFFNGLSASTETDFGENLSVSDYTEEGGGAFTIDLAAYGFDVKYISGEPLMQFQLANLFFSGSMYDAYYNGDMIYGVDTYQLMDDSEVLSTVRSSSYNSKTMSEDLKTVTDNYMALSFDYFYGLKDVKNIRTYEDAFDEYDVDLMASDRIHYKTLLDMTYDQDDLHTSYLTSGFYEGALDFRLTLDDLGPRSKGFNERYATPENQTYCSYTGYVLLDNDTVAKIRVKGFDESTMDEFETTMAKIESIETVEHIVLDLSCNTGGVLGIMIQMLGYMTDEPINFYQKTITDGLRTTTTYDVAIEARDYEWSILTSKLTFSAANSMASIASDMGVATIVGEATTGGASSITTNITPSGAIMLMSSAGVMTDNQFNSIEFGIEPDIYLSFPEYMDNETLINAIK